MFFDINNLIKTKLTTVNQKSLKKYRKRLCYLHHLIELNKSERLFFIPVCAKIIKLTPQNIKCSKKFLPKMDIKFLISANYQNIFACRTL